ncbi:Nitrate reductase, alpha subunit, partial [human gut metagenome]
KEDLSSTDMHPYVHVFQAAVDCAWETKSDWDTFRTLAETVSRVAKESGFTEYEDIVALPLGHDSPGEVAQPEGKVLDWSKGECEPIPGKTMPNLVHVKRDYSKIFEKYIALGPNIE